MLRGSQVVAGPEDPGAYKAAQLLPLTTECVESNLLFLSVVEGLTQKQQENVRRRLKASIACHL